MTDLLRWGLDFVALIQQYRNPVADTFMQHTTDLGGKYYIYFPPISALVFEFSFYGACLHSVFILLFYQCQFQGLIGFTKAI